MFFRAVATWYVIKKEDAFYEALEDAEQEKFYHQSHWMASQQGLKAQGLTAQWWPEEPVFTLLYPCATDESFYHNELLPQVELLVLLLGDAKLNSFFLFRQLLRIQPLILQNQILRFGKTSTTLLT